MKTDANQEHPNPHAEGGDKYERHIDGSIIVRGGIEAKFPPDLVQKHDREREEDSAQDYKKFVVEIVTLAFVIVVALLNSVQVYLSWDAGNTAKKQMIQSVRPWIFFDDEGEGGFSAGNVAFNEAGDAGITNYTVSLKNFSPYAAQNVFAASFLVITDNMKSVEDTKKLACTNYVNNPDINFVMFPDAGGKNRYIDHLVIPMNKATSTFKAGSQAFIAGCIGYRDQFGIIYRTKFVSNFRPVGQPTGGIQFDPSIDYRGKVIPGAWYMASSGIDEGADDHRKSMILY